MKLKWYLWPSILLVIPSLIVLAGMMFLGFDAYLATERVLLTRECTVAFATQAELNAGATHFEFQCGTKRAPHLLGNLINVPVRRTFTLSPNDPFTCVDYDRVGKWTGFRIPFSDGIACFLQPFKPGRHARANFYLIS